MLVSVVTDMLVVLVPEVVVIDVSRIVVNVLNDVLLPKPDCVLVLIMLPELVLLVRLMEVLAS